MKKLLSLLLCLAILASAVLVSNALPCIHVYRKTEQASSCIQRAATVYTCLRCSHSYKEYAPLYTAPDGFYTLLEAEREGDTLTVTVSIDNSPGLWGAAFSLAYSPDALEPLSAELGNALTDGATVLINTEKNHIRYVWQNAFDENAHDNGILFTATFNVKAKMSDWGLKLNYRNGDLVNYDSGPQTSTAISTVYLGWGEHSYDEGKITVSPTVDKEGEMLYTCTLCGETKTEIIAKLERYIRGDINGDGEISGLDYFDLKLILTQKLKPTPQQTAAANVDEDGDGEIGMLDSFAFKFRLAKGYWPDEE